jgi:AcrR family transcriptional regulator
LDVCGRSGLCDLAAVADRGRRSITRRTQLERTTKTRLALIDATIDVVNARGYNGASTALIAERAGVSRGAILHHFGTRAALMAEVIVTVYRRENAQYHETVSSGRSGQRIADWPTILWDVLSQPSGMAVLEILQATYSDPELANDVVAMQAVVENEALAAMRSNLGGNQEEARALMRLMVWSVRGLSIANRLMPDRDATRAAITLLARLLHQSTPSGRIDDLHSDPV